MELSTAIALIVVGLLLLAGGGEILVRSPVTLAEIAGVTPAVIGLTVVAIGTSLPELSHRAKPPLVIIRRCDSIHKVRAAELSRPA